MTVSCQWRIVRLVVTDKQVLFYKHEEEQKIENFQDLEQLSVTSCSLSKDSLSPLEVNALRLTHESLIKTIEGLKILFHEPPIKGAPLLLQTALQDTSQLESQEDVPTIFLSLQRDDDAFYLQRSLKLAQAWLKYKQACQSCQIWPCELILDWIQESIYNEKYPFPVQLEKFGDQNLDLQAEALSLFLMESQAIRSLKFSRDYQMESKLMEDKHLLINIKYDQILYLSLVNCNMDRYIIGRVVDIVSANSNIRKINFNHNFLTDDCLGEVSRIVENCHQLNIMELSNNKFKGDPQQFGLFFDIINLLQDELIEGIDEPGFKLALSNNLIGDDIVSAIEQFILFPVSPKILNLDLSFNQISKYNLWRLYKGYLKVSQTRQDLILNIFPLPFHPDILQDSINIFRRMKSEQPADQQVPIMPFHQYQSSQMRGQDQNDLDNQPNGGLAYQQSRNASIEIRVERLRNSKGKPLPNKKAYVDSIKIYKEKIALIMKDSSKTIESYQKLSQEIDGLPYEFPLCVLENFQEFIWQKLMEALLIRDHYSIGILKETGGLVGLDLEFFDDYFSLTATRRDCLIEKINRFLNFEELEEKDMNDELSFLVKECLRLDLRGPVVSQLFMIKEKRDEYINRQIDSGFIPEIDTAGIQRARGNCFLTLTGNEERKVVPKSVFSIPVNGNLFAHPARADYVVLAKLSQKLLLQLDETLDTVMQQYESNYFVDLAYKRVQFLLEDFENLSPSTSYAFFERIFTDGLKDLKLACVRIVLQHVNYQHRLLSRAITVESRKQPLTQRLQEIIMPLDAHSYSQQYTLTNFMYLRKFEFYFSQSEISLNSLTPADMFMDKLEETFVKPLVQFPVPECQPDCEKAMFKLVECIVLAKDSDAATTMPPVIAVLLHIMINSEFNPHIRDEVYLQVLKYLSKPLEDEHQFNILAMLSILFIYAPPSEELNHFMRAYMFRYVGRMRYDRLAQESLISLQISSTPQAAIPDWIPSTYEMKQRLQGYQKFIIVVNFPDRQSQEYSVTPFITAGQFMDQVYKDCKYFQKNALTDMYHFWVYIQSMGSSDEVALLYEEILLEIFSEYPSKNQTELIIKRRIYPPFFTMRLGEVHSVQLTCLLNEQLRLFYGYENEYIKSIPVAYVLRVAAYYLCIQLKGAIKKKIDKIEQKTVEQHLDMIIPVALKFNKAEVSQVIANMINKERILEKDIQNLSFNILSQLRYHPFYCSSRFDAIINESMRDQVSIVVNAMLINIFKKENLFIPSQSFYYEEVVSAIAIDRFTAIVQFFNKDSKQLIQLKFKFAQKRAHEFVQDIVSYAYFRIKDSNMALYAYSELSKLRYRHCLLSAPLDVGVQEPSSPFIMDINANLNEIERQETKDQLNQLSYEIVKTQYVQPDIGDYPYFKESTQFNLNFADRQMRRTSYSESQLQNWFNGVLMQRQKEQEELLRRQAEDDEASKLRNERLTLSGKGSTIVQAYGSQSGQVQNVQTQQLNPGNTKLIDSQNLGLDIGKDDKTKQQQQNSLQAISEIESSAGLSGRAIGQSDNQLLQNNQKGNLSNGVGDQLRNQQGIAENKNINNLGTPETDPGDGQNKGLIKSGRSSIADVNSNNQNSKKNSIAIPPNSQQDQQLPILNLPDKGSARSGQVPSTPVSDRSNSNQILKDKLTEKLKDAINLLPFPGGTPRQPMALKQQESSPLHSVEGVTSPLKIKKSPSVVLQPQGEGTQTLIQPQKISSTAAIDDPSLLKKSQPQQNSSIAPKEAEQVSSRKPSNTQVPPVDQLKPVEGSSSEDLPHLRHSRNSSRDNQKEKSPSESREKIKTVSRVPQNLLAFKNVKKSTGGSSRESLESSQQTSAVINNNNNEQIAPQGQPTEETEQVTQPPVLAARKPPTFFKKK